MKYLFAFTTGILVYLSLTISESLIIGAVISSFATLDMIIHE